MNKVLVTLSGGVDSLVCLALAIKKYGIDNVETISFNYGQKNANELKAVKRIAKHYGVYNKIIYQSGFSSLPNEKYYNNYTEISYTGHALTETNGWYGDYNVFVNKNLPWLKRGSNNNNGMYAGIFSFSYDYGGVSTSDLSSRFVITNE